MAKRFLFTILLVIAAQAARAGPIEESIVSQLREQGFSRIDITRTLLGRSRIVAQSRTLYREIIVNPSTGEILRDYWRGRSDGGTEIVDPGRGSGVGYDDDDEGKYDGDDRDEDDHDDEDNSGSGSSNSGSGSGNSGSGSGNSGSGSGNSGSGSGGDSEGGDDD